MIQLFIIVYAVTLGYSVAFEDYRAVTGLFVLTAFILAVRWAWEGGVEPYTKRKK